MYESYKWAMIAVVIVVIALAAYVFTAMPDTDRRDRVEKDEGAAIIPASGSETVPPNVAP